MTGDHVDELLGGYVLGALEPEDEERVRQHIDGCQECRDEHDRLAEVPALLTLVDLDNGSEAVAPKPPVALEAEILGKRPRASTHRTGPFSQRFLPGFGLRPAVAATAVAVTAIAVVLAVTGVLSTESSSPPPVRLASTTVPGATATADMQDESHGTRLQLDVRSLPATHGAEVYEVWFVRPGGRVSAGTFRVGRDGKADVVLTSAARPGSYQRLGITREPDGLNPARNGPNVLTGPLGG